MMLLDGTTALIRRLQPSDRPVVQQLFSTVDEHDLYTRFFTVGRHVVDRHIDHLFAPDTGVLTYLLERDGQLLGIADVEPLGEHCAEIAFLVADGAHGLGIGTLLLERAANDAWQRGVTEFVADVLAINHPMIEVFRDAGYEVELISQHDDVSVRMSTRPTPKVVAAAAARQASALVAGRGLS